MRKLFLGLLLFSKVSLLTYAHFIFCLNGNQVLQVAQLPGQPPPGVTALSPTLYRISGPQEQVGIFRASHRHSQLPPDSATSCPWCISVPFPGQSQASSCQAKGTDPQPQPPVWGSQTGPCLCLSIQPSGPAQVPLSGDMRPPLRSFSHVTQGFLLPFALAACESQLSNLPEALWGPLSHLPR